MGKRLYKSSRDKVLAGVCGGIGEYFDVDPVLIRILWVVSACFGGVGVLAYIIAAIIMPNEQDLEHQGTYEPVYKRTGQAGASGSSGPAGTSDRRMPGANDVKGAADSGTTRRAHGHSDAGRDGGVLAGAILIALGAFFMLREFMPWISGGLLAAVLFISLGIFMLVRRADGSK